MSKTPPFRLKCSAIDYRKGFIEVIPAIHDGCVSIETWLIAADANIDDCEWVDDENIADSNVIDNCEIEMTASEAQRLAEALLRAVENVS